MRWQCTPWSFERLQTSAKMDRMITMTASYSCMSQKVGMKQDMGYLRDSSLDEVRLLMENSEDRESEYRSSSGPVEDEEVQAFVQDH